MKVTLENLKSKGAKFVIELEEREPLVFNYRFDDPIFKLKEGVSELSVSHIDLPKCNCCGV